MSILNRKYPHEENALWIRDNVLYSVLVVAILYFFQPFGFSSYSGNKLVVSLLFGLVTFFCCMVYHPLTHLIIRKRVKSWKIWKEGVYLVCLILFIGLANFLLFSLVFHYTLSLGIFLAFLYWTFLIGIVITVVSLSLRYHRYLRSKLDALLPDTKEEQSGIQVTIHDTRVRGDDLTLQLNDLLFVEARKNNVAVFHKADGKVRRDEVQTSLSAVLAELGAYGNIFQCHRSYVVNINNISSAKGNSNGYTLVMGDAPTTVPVSRSFVSKLTSFVR